VTPPQHSEIASVCQHPDFVPTSVAAEHAFLLRRARDLTQPWGSRKDFG
jgi:hypothetical protein